MSATTPGLVCAHHHLYSALARGMPAPPATPTEFVQILEQVWWRLDVALDLEMIRWSAMLGALEALESGTTAIVDHHESPSAIDGSLDVIADACREVGVRVVCAYGVTDRHGPDGARARAGRERAVPARRRAGDGRRARRVHVQRRARSKRRPASPATSASASTSTSPRAPSTRTPGSASQPTPTTRGCSCTPSTSIDALPGTIAHNPRIEHEQRRRLRASRRPFEPDRARHRRHRRRHARRVPRSPSSVIARTTSPRRPRSRGRGSRTGGSSCRRPAATWCGGRTRRWSRGSSRTRPTCERSTSRSRARSCSRDGVATRVDAGEVRAKAAEQARRLHGLL